MATRRTKTPEEKAAQYVRLKQRLNANDRLHPYHDGLPYPVNGYEEDLSRSLYQTAKKKKRIKKDFGDAGWRERMKADRDARSEVNRLNGMLDRAFKNEMAKSVYENNRANTARLNNASRAASIG